MAENSKIEWTDHTWNPWIGCTKVSPGCANCYAAADMDTRRGRVKWGPNGTRSKTSAEYWRKPLKWNKDAEEARHQAYKHARSGPMACNSEQAEYIASTVPRPRVFCASLADVFEDWQGPIVDSKGNYILQCDNCVNPDNSYYRSAVEPFKPTQKYYEHACGEHLRPLTMDDLRSDLGRLVLACSNLDWLVVTKRPENARRMLTDMGLGNFTPNLWLLTSVENQGTADERIPELLKCRDLSPVLGLSCEPLLGPVQLEPRIINGEFENHQGINLDWVIAGGESGPVARPMHPDWACSLRDQCAAAGVPFFFKQWGEFLPACEATVQQRTDGILKECQHPSPHNPSKQNTYFRVGKKKSGRLLDGVLHDAFPTVSNPSESCT